VPLEKEQRNFLDACPANRSSIVVRTGIILDSDRPL
jgi:hypothetical protein